MGGGKEEPGIHCLRMHLIKINTLGLSNYLMKAINIAWCTYAQTFNEKVDMMTSHAMEPNPKADWPLWSSVAFCVIKIQKADWPLWSSVASCVIKIQKAGWPLWSRVAFLPQERRKSSIGTEWPSHFLDLDQVNF